MRVCLDAQLLGMQGDGLDAKVVFEIKYGGSVTKTCIQFTLRSNDRGRPLASDTLNPRKRIQPLPFAGLFFRNRCSDVTGWTGFAGIVRG